ncbi:Transmembrane 9 superfamily member 4, variant 2 [Balamuthia mandrillaris]
MFVCTVQQRKRTIAKLKMNMLVAVIVMASCIQAVICFNLPGSEPREFQPGERVPLLVGKLTSAKTQTTYRYYDLPFPAPAEVKDARSNLADILFGDVLENSLYEILAEQDESCKVVAHTTYKRDEVDEYIEKIEQEYRVHWVIDKLSSLTKQTNDQEKARNKPGFPLGSPRQRIYSALFFSRLLSRFVCARHVNAERKILLNNHVDITIFYHKNPTNNGIQVVGFEVKADRYPCCIPC